MKIAVCFCGQIRTGVTAAPNIKRFIGDLWDQCDFFIHTWNFESTKPYGRDSLAGVKLQPHKPRLVQDHEILSFVQLFPCKKILVEDYIEFSQRRPVTVPNVIWYTSEQVFKLKQLHESEQNFKYDVVLKIRPDIIYGASRRLQDEIDLFMQNPDILYSDVYSEKRLDDVLWVLSSDNANKFTAVSEYIDQYQVGDPSTVVLEFVKNQQIRLAPTARKMFQYAVFRHESLHRNPLTDFKEIFRDDILYYSVGLSEQEYRNRFFLEDQRGLVYD